MLRIQVFAFDGQQLAAADTAEQQGDQRARLGRGGAQQPVHGLDRQFCDLRFGFGSRLLTGQAWPGRRLLNQLGVLMKDSRAGHGSDGDRCQGLHAGLRRRPGEKVEGEHHDEAEQRRASDRDSGVARVVRPAWLARLVGTLQHLNLGHGTVAVDLAAHLLLVDVAVGVFQIAKFLGQRLVLGEEFREGGYLPLAL